MSGVLSQAIANLAASEQQVTNLSNLPQQAHAIQSASVALIGPAITSLQSMQQSIVTFVNQAGAELANVQQMVGSKQAIATISAAVANLQNEAIALKGSVDNYTTRINSTRTQILGIFSEIDSVESSLQSQITSLNAQLCDARSSEDATKKRYLYLLFLGPFGIIGLATALGLYLHWKSQVSDYESQISSLNAQVASINGMIAVCKQMAADFSDVMTKLSSVQNSIDFLGGDMLNVSQDLSQGSDYAVLSIVVSAASAEVSTLSIDAS